MGRGGVVVAHHPHIRPTALSSFLRRALPHFRHFSSKEFLCRMSDSCIINIFIYSFPSLLPGSVLGRGGVCFPSSSSITFL
jgi:hypothetical protein